MLAACKLNGFFPRHPVCRTLAVGRVSAIRPLAIVAVFAAMAWSSPLSVVHVWEKKELTFTFSLLCVTPCPESRLKRIQGLSSLPQGKGKRSPNLAARGESWYHWSMDFTATHDEPLPEQTSSFEVFEIIVLSLRHVLQLTPVGPPRAG